MAYTEETLEILIATQKINKQKSNTNKKPTKERTNEQTEKATK